MGEAVDTLAAEVMAVAAIAKQVVVSGLVSRSKNQSEKNRGEKGVLKGTPFLLFSSPRVPVLVPRFVCELPWPGFSLLSP